MKFIITIAKIAITAYALVWLGWSSQSEAFIAAVCISILIEVTKEK